LFFDLFRLPRLGAEVDSVKVGGGLYIFDRVTQMVDSV
jgi:hypothetical protein